MGEAPYRIDRLLTQLRLAGVLAAVSGVLLGSFSGGAAPGPVLPLLREVLLPLGVPLLAGWPAGHGTQNLPLPLGIRVRLDADAGSLALAGDGGPGIDAAAK